MGVKMQVSRGQLDVQLERLEECFGERHFGEQRSRMIWLAVEGLEYGDVITIVDTFIKRSKHAPLPQEFTDAAREYKRTGRSALGEDQPNPNCHDCRDSGFMWVTYRGKSGWGPCACDRGRQLIEADRRRTRPIGFRTQYGPHWHERGPQGEGA